MQYAGKRWLFLLGSLAALGAGVLWYTRRDQPRLHQADQEPVSLAPLAISSSPFLNTRPEVAYVGSEACRSCHAGHTTSFHRSPMGRSFGAVDPEREPPDAIYDHVKSKRRYQVLRQNGQVWQRELLLTDGQADVVLSEHPLKYVVGSGRHALTYVVEVEGFLAQSPLTWYASKKSWAMTPTYDVANQPGFERPIRVGCLHCHAGQVEASGASPDRVAIREATISCERCHGPGALHVARHSPPNKRDNLGPAIDYTIVNPIHLPRNLAESICQVCHLTHVTSILARGRAFNDFRPGLPLQEFRHDFHLAEEGKTVVGHVEQMHGSRCYQGSKTFSCLTCHDPHRERVPRNRQQQLQSICLQCHQAERCKVDPALRIVQEPGNHCVHCHMPPLKLVNSADIPHLAFTHHRVGIHDPAKIDGPPPTRPRTMPTLEPILDLGALPELDRRRSLGLAYDEIAHQSQDARLARHFREQAQGLLNGVRSAGLREGAVDVALAGLNFQLDGGAVMPLAQAALDSGSLTEKQRCYALALLADSLSRAGRKQEAIPILRELAQLRRDSTQMLLLASCEQAVGDDRCVQSLERAVQINPRLWQVHEQLGNYFRGQGDQQKADYHRKRAVQ
jgi:predicted CXXCH cytochrome family protein